jgi:hypothetical protein
MLRRPFWQRPTRLGARQLTGSCRVGVVHAGGHKGHGLLVPAGRGGDLEGAAVAAALLLLLLLLAAGVPLGGHACSAGRPGSGGAQPLAASPLRPSKAAHCTADVARSMTCTCHAAAARWRPTCRPDAFALGGALSLQLQHLRYQAAQLRLGGGALWHAGVGSGHHHNTPAETADMASCEEVQLQPKARARKHKGQPCHATTATGAPRHPPAVSVAWLQQP